MIELIISIVVLMALSVAVYQMHAASQVKAEVQREQKHTDDLVTAFNSVYAMAPSFEGITFNALKNAGVQNISDQSAFGTAVRVQSAAVNEPNDAYDLIYDVKKARCIGLVSANQASTYTILVNGHQVQDPNSKVLDEQMTATQCATSTPEVALRFHAERNYGAATEVAACICAPSDEEQSISCGAGQTGSITQKRSSSCTGGSPTCRTAVWTSWTTSSNTCVADPSSPVVPVVTTPAAAACVPMTHTRSQACPTGQAGSRLEQRILSCPSNTWGPWGTISDTCQPAPTTGGTCTPSTRQRTATCPSGQGGQIIEQQSSSCPTSTGSEVWGAWSVVSSTCTSQCMASGNCCTVGSDHRNEQQQCIAGQYGNPTAQQTRNSTCASATATPVWGSWYNESTTGSCNACPSPTSESNDRWVGQSAACASGQVGSHTWERQERQTRSTSYNCPAGTTTLPSPTVSAWSAWAATGATRNDSNTCATCPSPQSETQTIACPTGQTGSITQQRSRSYNCSGSGSWNAWSAWADTSNTCVAPPAAVCDYKTRTDVNWAGENINAANPWTPLRACNASNIGQKAYANYTSCGGAGCYGTYKGLECTASGWKSVAGAGSSPYVAWTYTTQPAEYTALQNQGHLDWQQQSIDAGRTIGTVDRSWTIYQCL
ncbi:hypothetical protein [Pseudoxanthomonas winnipegensis]|uniref:Type 4 secretion system PilS N-terminal domain-containing protein n=1 Tax=Pseudoxanthomonas winnipegensis TaxID=2480810 RepID=A0A4Q8M4F7_9GAMM|nr:hypothetical protein [Pseudoxanthomonas winnipegensis]TAA41535.1 hypothetical protein EA655_11375 [Pseudoxanthomonas winnipegensis]